MRCLRFTAQVYQNQNVLMEENFVQDPISRTQDGDRCKVIMEGSFVWLTTKNINIFNLRSNSADNLDTIGEPINSYTLDILENKRSR